MKKAVTENKAAKDRVRKTCDKASAAKRVRDPIQPCSPTQRLPSCVFFSEIQPSGFVIRPRTRDEPAGLLGALQRCHVPPLPLRDRTPWNRAGGGSPGSRAA